MLSLELKNRLGLLPGMSMVVEEDDEERVCLRVRTESPDLSSDGRENRFPMNYSLE
jgi:hypothetical protein